MKQNFRFYRATHLETGEVKLIIARNDGKVFYALDEYASPYEFLIEEIDPESLPPILIDLTADKELKEELMEVRPLRILQIKDLNKAFKNLLFC